jgi:hypothetical protein
MRPADALAPVHYQSSDGTQAGDSVVLDVAEYLWVFAVVGVGSYVGHLGTGHVVN